MGGREGEWGGECRGGGVGGAEVRTGVGWLASRGGGAASMQIHELIDCVLNWLAGW